VYRANPPGFAAYDMFSVPLDRSTGPRRLYEALLGGVQATPAPVLSPDGERVVFCAEAEAYFASLVVSARVEGGEPALSIDAYRHASDLAVTPDSARAVFLSLYGTNPDRSADLHSVPLDGSRGSVFVNEDVPPTGDVLSYRASGDGARVVY